MSTLILDNIGKRFGGFRIFEKIDLTVNSGEIIGIIGPNGAGKTTLVNIATGAIPISEGKILLDDVDISRFPVAERVRRGLTRTFQQGGVFGELTIKENLEWADRFGQATGRNSGERQSVDKLADMIGLASLQNQIAKDQPYGLQKVLSLLMALLARPLILLMDEPAAGLEFEERHWIDEIVAKAVEKHRCGILIVEHDMSLIKRLCEKAIVLEGGRVLASGKPSEVLRKKEVIDAYLGASAEAEFSKC